MAGRESGLSRRELLKRAGVGAAAVGLGGSAGAEKAFGFYGPLKYKNRRFSKELKILQWVHFVPDYDTFVDKTWIPAWEQKNDTEVTIDHVNNTELPARAAAEVAAQSGHDLFMFLNPRADLEDQVINHAEIVQEVQQKVGKISQLGKLSTYNPRTKRYHGFSDNFVPDPVVWRHDLWNDVGESPATWEHVRAAAPKLRARGNPIGIGMSNELDSDMALIAFLQCYGGFIQNKDAQPTINSKGTIEALKVMRDIYKNGMTNEIFGWNPASNNQFLYSGKGSLILNAISATRTPEDLKLPFADNLWIWPIPRGPHMRMGLEHVMGVYVIWKFAKNKGPAKRYLADMAIAYQQHFTASKFYNFPTFPGAVKNIQKQLAQDKHKPLGKYTILGKIASKYTANVGYPGYSNAAVSEIFNTFLIPQMFAEVAQDKMSPADAARAAQNQFKVIFNKWRNAKKI
jgi:multiple sugar transport system substrate-binding protein